MNKTFCRILFLLSAIIFANQLVGAPSEKNTCPTVKIVAEQLPDMNTPRAGHVAFCVNNEIVVVGGHTSGFVPTAAAEYFRDGKWHPMQAVYPHDNGFAVRLNSGKVLIAGGHDQALGIGQSFVAEMYDPVTHTFDGFGCLDKKRSLANGALLTDGQVVIAGNHYADDCIEVFDGKKAFTFAKNVEQFRAAPIVLPTADGDALILGGADERDHPLFSPVVDRLKRPVLNVPLLQTWRPLPTDIPTAHSCSLHQPAPCPHGEGRTISLLPVQNKDGQVAVVMVRDTVFTLLPTQCPVPMKSQWGAIVWGSPIVVDSNARCAYMTGFDSTHRLCILRIDLNSLLSTKPSSLTLFYTDPTTEIGSAMPILTPEGNLMIAGGIIDSNFHPLRSAWLLRFAPATAAATGVPVWFWVLIAVAALALVLYLIIIYKRREKRGEKSGERKEKIEERSETAGSGVTALLQSVCELMESEKMFLDKNLRISDVATILKTNTSYLSDSINKEKGLSFSQFVNSYRVDHAIQLMRQHPGEKLSNVALASGFANETSFFRSFKAITGMAPREWIKKQ